MLEHTTAGPPALQSLSVGTKLWGAVMEVSPHGLVVSLPHGLRGSVAYAEVRSRVWNVCSRVYGPG